MHRSYIFQGIDCRCRTTMHWEPSDLENRSVVCPCLHTCLVSLHRRRTQEQAVFCLAIDHSNNKASQSWSLSLPAKILLQEILRLTLHCIAPGTFEKAHRGHVAWRKVH